MLAPVPYAPNLAQYGGIAGVAANTQVLLLPANCWLLYMMLRETAGIGLSVGLGTSAGTFDIASAQAVAGNGTFMFPISSLTKGWLSLTQALPVWLNSASWGGAKINAQLVYQVGP